MSLLVITSRLFGTLSPLISSGCENIRGTSRASITTIGMHTLPQKMNLILRHGLCSGNTSARTTFPGSRN